MIAITGAGGFIGSAVLSKLNQKGIEDVCLYDDLELDNQYLNLVGKRYKKFYRIEEACDKDITAVIHLGANSNTLEKDWKKIYKSNVLSTRIWHEFAKTKNIPFVFSSSAAVYGNGHGPLNLYAFSKQVSENELDRATILRLFNVYGPNEYHKGRMASTIYHWHRQISETGKLKIFENSHQFKRDFVYVEDVADVILWFLDNFKPGIYDLGSGRSENFDRLADELIENLDRGLKEYIKMPQDLNLQYQKNTISDLSNLEKAGYDTTKFRSLSDGLKTYLNYLDRHAYL